MELMEQVKVDFSEFFLINEIGINFKINDFWEFLIILQYSWIWLKINPSPKCDGTWKLNTFSKHLSC